MRSTIMALAAAFVAVGGYAAFAQSAPDAGPDRSQDIAWMSAQQAYLTGLRQADGWRYMDGGLRWRRISGDGSGAHPSAADTVTVHYEGSFIDGAVFDSSHARGEPATFPLARLIPAWQKAIPEMGVGDTIEIAVPASLGYGPTGKGPIPGGATLLFEVELIDIPGD